MRLVHLCHLDNAESCNPTAPSYENASHARCEFRARHSVVCDVRTPSASSWDVAGDDVSVVSVTYQRSIQAHTTHTIV